MIPAPSTSFAEVTGAIRSFEYKISQNAASQAMLAHVLRNSLYTRKILAILREVTWNALDIHVMSGKADVKVLVKLPTRNDPVLVIRDYGTGLSPDDVEQYLLTLGESTKRDTNEAVGFMGVGAKAPHCYTDSFQVTSYHGGFKRVYISVLGADNKGEAHLIDESPSDEVGIEYNITIRPSDIDVVHREAQHIFRYVADRIDLRNSYNVAQRPTFEWEGTTGGLQSYEYNVQWEVVMGGIPYRLDMSNIPGVPEHFLTSVGGAIFVGPSDVDVAASREDVTYTARTQAAVLDALDKVFTEFGDKVINGILMNTELSHFAKRAKLAGIVQLMPSVRKLPSVAELLNEQVFFEPSEYNLKFYRNEYSRLRNVLKHTEAPRITQSTRILVLDDHRDYEPHLRIDDNVLLVTADHKADEDFDLYEEVERFFEAHLITGVPLLDEDYLTEVETKVGRPKSTTAVRRIPGKTFEMARDLDYTSYRLPTGRNSWLSTKLDVDTKEPTLVVPLMRWAYSGKHVIGLNHIFQTAAVFGLKFKVIGVNRARYEKFLAKANNPNFFSVEQVRQAVTDHCHESDPDFLERCARHVGSASLLKYGGAPYLLTRIRPDHPIRDIVNLATPDPSIEKVASSVVHLVFGENTSYRDESVSHYVHPEKLFHEIARSVRAKYPLTKYVKADNHWNGLNAQEFKDLVDYIDLVDSQESK